MSRYLYVEVTGQTATLADLKNAVPGADVVRAGRGNPVPIKVFGSGWDKTTVVVRGHGAKGGKIHGQAAMKWLSQLVLTQLPSMVKVKNILFLVCHSGHGLGDIDAYPECGAVAYGPLDALVDSGPSKAWVRDIEEEFDVSKAVRNPGMLTAKYGFRSQSGTGSAKLAATGTARQ